MSDLVDGQLDQESADRAWSHVLVCPSCRRLVEREGWVKTRLSTMGGGDPPDRLVGSLYDLGGDPAAANRRSWEAFEAWVEVDRIERKGRGRRRAGLAVAGAGSVSAAVLGIASLGGVGMGIGGGAPASPPATSFTRATPGPASAGATPYGVVVQRQMRPPLVSPSQRPVLELTRR